MKNLKPVLVLSIFILTFFSCTDIFDCLSNKHPEISDLSQSEISLGNSYYAELFASVKNEPRDDNYDYSLSVHGDFPEGISYSINDRVIAFEGIPTSSGTYTFVITVIVDPGTYYDNETGQDQQKLMCDNQAQKTFDITVR